mgnify:FL=1
MNNELLKVAITPAIRALVQVIASKYALGDDVTESVVGAVVVIGTVAWSIWEKKQIKQSATEPVK